MRIHWYTYFQVLSLLCAIFCRRGLRLYSLGIMIPILVLDLGTELIGTNWRIFHWKNNYLIYNLYLVLSTPLFLYLFSILLALTRQQKRYYFGAAILLEVLVLYNFFFQQGPSEFNTYSNLLIQGANIILSCLAIARLAIGGRDEEAIILQDPRFCLNAMILLFSLVTLILLGLQKYIVVHDIEIRHKVLYFAIMPIANAVLYTGYSCAFLLCRMQTSK
jgi:hypothetical protein